MVDVLANFLGYQAADLKNQAMQSEMDFAQQYRPLALESERLKIQQEHAAINQQNLMNQALSAPDVQGQPSMGMGDSLLQQGDNLKQLGYRITKAGNPKLGLEFIQQGRETQKDAMANKKQELDQQQAELKQVANWVNQTTDQTSLDNVRMEVESMYPGEWTKLNLPTIYNTDTAKRLKQMGMSVLNAQQQVETQIKMIESGTAQQYFQTKLEKAQVDTVNARIDTEQKRYNLAHPKDTTTAYDKYLDEKDTEQKRYESELADARLKIKTATTTFQGVTSPKYSAQSPEPTSSEKYAAYHLFRPNDVIAQKPSPQAEALATATKEITDEHNRRVAAIESKAASKGIAIPKPAITKSTKTWQSKLPNMSGLELKAKARASNPNMSDDELENNMRSLGYIQ